MKQRVMLPLLLSASVLMVTSCQQKPSTSLEFDVFSCNNSDGKCSDERPDLYKFKVRKYENLVVLSVFDSDGEPIGNTFFKDCQIVDRKNWKCESDGQSWDMLEGRLVTPYSEYRINLNSEALDKTTFLKYVPRQ